MARWMRSWRVLKDSRAPPRGWSHRLAPGLSPAPGAKRGSGVGEELRSDAGDVLRVVAGAVVRAVKGQAQEAESLGHAHFARQAEGEREPRLDVEMAPAEGILDAEGAALALELQPIEVAVARPDALPRGVAP